MYLNNLTTDDANNHNIYINHYEKVVFHKLDLVNRCSKLPHLFMAITTDLSVATNYFITKAPFTYFNEEVIFLDYGNINYRGRMQDDLIIITLISLNVTDCYFYAVDFISISVDFLRVAEDVIDRLLVKRIL